jgi:general L-amino acid transport system substrate-binding protein
MSRAALARMVLATGCATGVLILAACGSPASERDEASTTAAPDLQNPPQPAFTEDRRTLDAVRRRGRLNCGVHEGLAGFALRDNRGQWRGFDIDFCRAVAAAVLGDADAVTYTPLNPEQRFEALADGRIDVLWRSTSWTLVRDADPRFVFAGVNYYDGQGFLVRRSLGLMSAAELSGARICVQNGSTSQLNAEDYFRSISIEYRPVVFENFEAARQAYGREECDAFTADISSLAAARFTLPDLRNHAILADVISKEPLGPVVRGGDEHWASVVRWTLNALILAEEMDVTRANVRGLAEDSQSPDVRRLLGAEGDFGSQIGLARNWAVEVVAATGNYGEIFERNIGGRSALDLERGLNALWNADAPGLIYGLPIR